MVAITQLSAEKNLSKEVVLSAVESALVSAYKKDTFSAGQDVAVKIDPNTGGVKVFVRKTVVETPADPLHEISLADAHKIDRAARLDEILNIEATPPNAGRIAAQTARQVILQRLHEAEHHAIFEEFTCREGDVITGMIQRITPDQIYVDIGKAEAILPYSEQIHNERYRTGQRLKFYLLEVTKTARGPQIVVSRSHRNLLRRMFELEVPEIFSGAVEIRSVAREAGHRSKVAVAARQEGIDPVGCCVGLRGIRIQNIVNELNDEKIDVIEWIDDPKIMIANALSPAQVSSVELNAEENTALVSVPDKQLSLAIGKEGQNARLAAKLTGWRIDIKSLSVVEAERASMAKAAAEKEETAEPHVAVAPSEERGEAAAEVVEEAPTTIEEFVAEVTEEVTDIGLEEFTLDEIEEEEEEEQEEEEQEQVSVSDLEFVLSSSLHLPEQNAANKIRFAEDILPSKGSSGRKKSKKDIDLKDSKSKSKKGRGKKVAYSKDDEYEG